MYHFILAGFSPQVQSCPPAFRESCEGLSHSCSHRDLPGRTKTFHHQKSVNHFEQQSSESGPMLPQGGNGGRGGRGRGGNMAGGKGRGRGRGSAGGRGSGLGQADVAMKPGGNGDSDRQSVNNARRWEEKKEIQACENKWS